MYVCVFIGFGIGCIGLGLIVVGKYDSAMRVSYMRLSLLLPTYLGYGGEAGHKSSQCRKGVKVEKAVPGDVKPKPVRRV